MRSPPSSSSARRSSRGFTLVELMIGMLIGLMATLAVTQVMINAEGQKRTTTSGSDAQINGALALTSLQRSIRSAGYGFGANTSSVGCTLTASVSLTGFPTILAPVVITQGAAGAPDAIRVLASGKASYSVPLRIVAPGYNPASPTLKSGFPVTSVRSVLGPRADSSGTIVSPGDLMIAVVSTSQPCEVFQVSVQPTSTPPLIARTDDSKWNVAGKPSAIYGDGNYLINMGAFVDERYSIGSSTLRVSSLKLAADSTPSYTGPTDLFPNIVNLKAMYGKDTNGDSVIDIWDNTTPTTNAGWLQVLAVRIAVVARSTQYEKEEVTGVNPSWDVGTALTVNDQSPAPATCGTSKCLSLKVDADADWKHYRYKIFDTVIPLRNMLWNS